MRRPLSPPVRLWAAASYLLPVAVVALLHPEMAQVRLVREHAANALALGLMLLGPMVVLGSGRGGPLEWLMLVGLLLTLWLVVVFGLVAFEAVRAWQGRRPWAPWAPRVASWLPRPRVASAPGLGAAGVRPAELGDVGGGRQRQQDGLPPGAEGPDFPL